MAIVMKEKHIWKYEIERKIWNKQWKWNNKIWIKRRSNNVKCQMKNHGKRKWKNNEMKIKANRKEAENQSKKIEKNINNESIQKKRQ